MRSDLFARARARCAPTTRATTGGDAKPFAIDKTLARGEPFCYRVVVTEDVDDVISSTQQRRATGLRRTNSLKSVK